LRQLGNTDLPSLRKFVSTLEFKLRRGNHGLANPSKFVVTCVANAFRDLGLELPP